MVTVSDTIGDQFVSARAETGGLEAARVLAQVNERLFGIVSTPLQVGRFVILRRLGAGGMGVVYLGYDRELDRNVALKLLRARAHGAEATAKAEARLLREARALARVDHPNVIAIYEVGTDQGAVYLAMENVEGSTLSQWQCEKARSWRDIVDVYLQAGRGLAAAHAAGIAHRDFKPDNVLVSSGGDGLGPRARVVDFGLAWLEVSPEEDLSVSSSEPKFDNTCTLEITKKAPEFEDVKAPASSHDVQDMEGGGGLTLAGTLLGTPAYMAPEQIEGRPADARSDQFSFALALYEALMGERAFVGDSVESLHAAVRAGRRRKPRSRRLPRGLRRILDRCLEVDPTRRYPGMVELLADIERGLATTKRWLLATGAVSLAVAAGLLGSAAARPQQCVGGESAIATVWHATASSAAQAAFMATDKPFAAKAWSEVQRRIDSYAEGWAAMHDDACAATLLRAEQSSEALDLRMACLDRRRDELAALVEVFTHQPLDPTVVSRAVEATQALTPLAGCADVEALAAPEPLPEDPRIRADVDSMRIQLARAKARRDAGSYAEALTIVEQVDEEASGLGYGPLIAESALLLGSLHGLTGEAERAGVDYERSFAAALASGHDDVAMWAAIHAVHVVGFVGRRSEEGRRWAQLATPLVARRGYQPRAQVSLDSNIGNIAVVQGNLDEAQTRFANSIEMAGPNLGEDDVLVAKVSANLGSVYRRKGQYEQALAAYGRAEAIFTQSVGTRHPMMATLANNVGALHYVMENHELAENSYRSVLELAGTSISATSPTLGHAHNNLGELLLERGDNTTAVEHFEMAIDIWEQAHGPKHPLIAHPLIGLGKALMTGEKPEQALGVLRRALELRTSNDASTDKIEEVRGLLAQVETCIEVGRSGNCER